MRGARVAAAILVVALPPGRAHAQSALEQARAFYADFQFERCIERASSGATLDSDAERAQLEIVAGLCQFSLNHPDAARARFAAALALDPDARLPAFTSPKIAALFEDVKASAVPVEARPAATVAEPPPRPIRLPLLLGAAALAAALGGTYAGVEARRLEGVANASSYQSEVYANGIAARRSATVANVCFTLAGATAVAGLLTYLLRPVQ